MGFEVTPTNPRCSLIEDIAHGIDVIDAILFYVIKSTKNQTILNGQELSQTIAARW
jgi:hypothetical protein